MMIKFIIIYILLPILSITQSNKSIEVTYLKGYKNHKGTDSSPPKIMKNLEYLLICSLSESRFEYTKKMSNDGEINQRFIGRGGGSGVYYKNNETNHKIRQVNRYTKTFLIDEQFDQYNWKLTGFSKEILGYKCFKAIASFEEYNPIEKKTNTFQIVAWYAPNFPYSFGPAGYDGLPGLVLEASRGNFYFIASKIVFHDSKPNIVPPSKGEKITRNDFNKMISDALIERFRQ